MFKDKITSNYNKNKTRSLINLKQLWFLFFILFFIESIGCSKQTNRLFGTLPDGKEIYMYTLTNDSGMVAKIINYGATVVSLTAPDRNGNYQDVVLGYDNLQQYVDGTAYFGAIVGRYGNRIGKGKFKINEKEYQLTINNGKNHLHGGNIGFNKVVWDAKPIGTNSLQLTYVSQDGEEGYPGNVTLVVLYTITDDNGLKIEFSGSTDAPTILNPTNHSYFNLSGSPEKVILNHKLFINADKFTPVDEGLITTGELTDVTNTPMDFREPTPIGKRISNNDSQLKYGKGYDHNWVLNNFDGNVRLVASVSDSSSGRVMEVLTDQSGLQFYSGNFLNGSDVGKNGVVYNHRTGLCLEAQCFPDSPNKPNFPSPLLQPGEEYKQTTIYRFSVVK